jgi:two-component system phosphate regulon sensor histidine kinase PhoR
MDLDLERRQPHLVLRFAVGAVAAFLLTGAGVTVLTMRSVTDRAERVATFHAEFVADAVLVPALRGTSLERPLSGEPLTTLDAIVRNRILNDRRDVRVKIWGRDATVLYSDYPPLIGRRFPEEEPELDEVLAGGVSSSVSDLSAAENVGERSIADKLFQTYVPLRRHPGGPIVAVAELYQAYSVIQGDIDSLVRTLTATFAAGLVILFAALLPIALRASRALRTQNRQLRDQAGQLGVLLAREQQTAAELRDLNQRKTDFVSAASHELRTPLTAIVGYVRTLRRPEFADDAALRDEFLDGVEQQSNRLFRLIKGLLTSSRLEDQGVQPLDLSPIDFREIALDAAEHVRLNGRLLIDVSPDASTVVTDRDRVREILVELLDNAVKYSPDGGSVEVSTRAEADRFVFSVRDHGLGIDPEARGNIFERFYQQDQSATRRFGGLGLGLYIVSGLVRELGGTVSVESEVGAGSTFTVALPRAGRAEADPGRSRGEESTLHP